MEWGARLRPRFVACWGAPPLPGLSSFLFYLTVLEAGFLSVHGPLHPAGELEKHQGAKTLSFKSSGAQVDPQSKHGSPTGEPWFRSGVPGPRPAMALGPRRGHTLPPSLGFLGAWGEGSTRSHGHFFLLGAPGIISWALAV